MDFFLPNAAAVCERGDIFPSTLVQQVCEERRGPGHEIKGPSNGVGPATFPNKMKSKISDADLLQRKKQSEADKAEKTMHSTAKQAATIAIKANAKHLLLGHYSTRYDSIDLFKQEAETIFSNLLLADDGKIFEF